MDQALRDALNAQGLMSFNAFASLKDDDIKQICANIRKPGGTIANPNAAISGQPPTIPNPGIAIGHVTKRWLKMLAYYVNHLVCKTICVP
jgi:hypothetical protein